MKKQIVILFCLAFLSLAHASHSMVPDKSHRINFTELGRELAAQPTRILKKDKTKAALQSGIPHCDVRSEKLKDGHIYQRIAMPGLERVGVVGLPERPFREELVRITSGTEVKLVIDHIDWHDIHEQIQLAPVQPPLPDMRIPDGERPDMAIPFEKDVAAYTVDEFTSQNPVSLGERVRIRGKEYITVIYNPISYNSKKKQVRIAYNVSWHLNIQEPSSTEAVRSDLLKKTQPEKKHSRQLDLRSSRQVEAQDQVVTSDFVLGPELVGGAADADYLIITADEYAEEVAPLAEWKHKKGFRTYVATLTEVGGSSENDIKTYIKNAYSTGRQTAFVLLVGDHEDLPGAAISYHPSCYGSNVPYYSDMPYACVDGTDFYPDLIIGRLPGDTESQITTMVDKILGYEKTPDASNRYDHILLAGMFQDNNNNYTADRWFMEVLHRAADFLGPDYGFGTGSDKGYTIHTALQWATDVNHTLHYRSSSYSGRSSYPDPVPLAWINEGNGDANKINATIDTGVGLVIHRDHGYASYGGEWYDGLGWGDPDYRTGDVAALNNGTKLPFVFSLNCGTGHWEDRDAFAETWIRHENGGAVGFTGAARISYSGPNDTFLVGLMDSFWDDYSSYPNLLGGSGSYTPSFRPAEALTRAKAYVLATWGSGNTNYGTLTARLFNWFGDPEQAMRTETPLALSAVHPDSLEVGTPADFDVAVTQDGSPLSNAQVAIVLDQGYFYVAQTDSSGKAHFGFIPTATGSMSVTVSEQNSIPYEGIIDVKNVDKPPVAQCKKNTVLNLDPSGQVILTPGQVDDGSYDPEGQEITYSLSKENFNCSDVGGVPQPVILTVTDEDELEDQCLSNVTVVDNLPPVPDVEPLPDVTGECSVTVSSAPTALDNCAGRVTGTTNDPLSYSEQGTYMVTWIFEDASENTSTQTQQVVVEDTIAPNVVTKNITVQLDADGTASITPDDIDNGFDDNCGIKSMTVSPSSFTCADIGANSVTLTVTDNSGNTSTATATVTVEDNIFPTIDINAPATIIPPDAPISFTATVTDNCSATVEIEDYRCYGFTGNGKEHSKMQSCVVSASGDTLTITDSGGVGDNIVWTIVATDQSGNTTTTEGHVLVVNPGKSKK